MLVAAVSSARLFLSKLYFGLYHSEIVSLLIIKRNFRIGSVVPGPTYNNTKQTILVLYNQFIVKNR